MDKIRFASDIPTEAFIESKIKSLQAIFAKDCPYTMLGWTDVYGVADDELTGRIAALAERIRNDADVLVVIGVGGSNQGARAAAALLGDSKVEILYSGNSLSSTSMRETIRRLEGKSVYLNIIAKNFQTLEPGVAFRVLRNYMIARYGEKEAASRMIATGTSEGDSLWTLSQTLGMEFLPFPQEVGGRFSVFSAVGLLPMAVAGIDITELLRGAHQAQRYISGHPFDNDALRYAAARNILHEQGKAVEFLAYFEPGLHYFAKWWVQLFGESEGKDGKGIFPAHGSYSEDLHSLGQYVQDGSKLLFETFLHIEDTGPDFWIPESAVEDGFAYLNGRGFDFLNHSAYQGTVGAHQEGGIPALTVTVPELSAYTLGQLFYFFLFACYYSAVMLGVNPFDQPGVEAYKTRMFQILKG
jgi:glucose-6-phosphate isomerase